MIKEARNSQVIQAGHAQEASAWELPSVGGKTNHMVASTHSVAGDIELIKQQAMEQGLAEGRNVALAEVQQKLQDITAVMQTLDKPLSELGEDLEQDIMQLAAALAQHILQQEIEQDTSKLLSIIREIKSALPAVSQSRVIYLNPQDLAVVQQAVTEGMLELKRCQLLEQSNLTRGECRVVTDRGEIDGTVAGKVAAIAVKLTANDQTTQDEATT